MIRRLLLVTAVAGAAFAPGASAQTEPPCYGVLAGGYTVAYCAGIVCNDLCYWVSYPVCEQPDESLVDVCGIVNKLPSIR